MISDLEIYRAANQLVKRFGEAAGFETAQRVDAMLEAGDIDGQRQLRDRSIVVRGSLRPTRSIG